MSHKSVTGTMAVAVALSTGLAGDRLSQTNTTHKLTLLDNLVNPLRCLFILKPLRCNWTEQSSLLVPTIRFCVLSVVKLTSCSSS